MASVNWFITQGRFRESLSTMNHPWEGTSPMSVGYLFRPLTPSALNFICRNWRSSSSAVFCNLRRFVRLASFHGSGFDSGKRSRFSVVPVTQNQTKSVTMQHSVTPDFNGQLCIKFRNYNTCLQQNFVTSC